MGEYREEPVYIMANKDITAWWNGEYLTIEDSGRDGIAMTEKEAIELAQAIMTHLGGPL